MWHGRLAREAWTQDTGETPVLHPCANCSSSRSELHFRRLPDRRGLRTELEELHLPEAEGISDEVGGKALQAAVVLCDRVVVELAGEADAVLGALQFLLHVTKVLVRLQIRIRFRDGEQALERPRE